MRAKRSSPDGFLIKIRIAWIRIVELSPGQWLDTSKPWLEAMRTAANQLSGERPGFIAIQFQDLDPEDLMLPHLRRRAAILSAALVQHYGAAHINAVYVCGYRTAILREGRLGAPAFAIINPEPKFETGADDAVFFLSTLPDEDYAALIGAPLPDEPISGPTGPANWLARAEVGSSGRSSLESS